MAKNRWYEAEEDAFLRRGAQALALTRQPYGRRGAVYQRLALEVARRFKVRRSWQGIQQRIRKLAPSDDNGITNR